MKKTISFVLALLMIFCLSVPAMAAGGQDGNIKWKLDSNSRVLTISGRGAIRDYDSETETAPWFMDSMMADTVVIESGITRIGDNAFSVCLADNIVIPGTVESIGESGIACTAFTSITLPEGLEQVEMMGLALNTFLTDISFPGTLRVLGDAALLGCTELESIVLNEGLVSMGTGALSMCEKLESVYIPASLKNAGTEIFMGSPVKTIIYGGSESQWNALVSKYPGLKASGATVRFNASSNEKTASDSNASNNKPSYWSTSSPRSGYISNVTGSWSDEPVKNRLYQTKYPFEFDEPLINCTSVTLIYNYSVVSGDPYGSWYLYARDLDGNWSSLATFRLEEGSDNRDLEFVFDFDKPVSFDAITLGKVYDSNYSINHRLALVDAYVNP